VKKTDRKQGKQIADIPAALLLHLAATEAKEAEDTC
jgi:hypothetical protein